MNATPSLPGFAIGGIQVWPDLSDFNLWYWLPGAPQPQLTPDCKPQISLISLGDTAILQLGVQWTASQEALDQLPRHIADYQKLGGAAITKLRLTPATAQISRVVLKIGSADAMQEIATAHPSNTVPYAAALSASLDSSKASAAKAALGGEQGLMFIRYEASLALTNAATASLAGDVAAALSKMPQIKSSEDASVALKKFEASGVLTWKRSASANASNELRAKADAAVREKAIAMLIGIIKSRITPAQSKIFSSAELKEASNCEVYREQDLSNWLVNSDGTQLIQK